jgi:hypothetical protein
MNWGNTLTISVPIDGNGSGRWDLNQVDSGYIPAGTTWLGRVVDSGSGTTSNEITVVWPATATSTDQPTDPYANMTLSYGTGVQTPSYIKGYTVIRNGPPNTTIHLEVEGGLEGYRYLGQEHVYIGPKGPHYRLPVKLDVDGYAAIKLSFGGPSVSTIVWVVEKTELRHTVYYYDGPGA